MEHLPNGDVRLKLSRASTACRRCRRLRTRCENIGGKPPCAGCRKAGHEIAQTCTFVARGHSHHDREYRTGRRRQQSNASPQDDLHEEWESQEDRTSPRSQKVAEQLPLSPAPSIRISADVFDLPVRSGWDALPPFEEVVEGCKTFWTCCFQVGFIPRRLFLERLSRDRESSNIFLLFSILAVSARFTPSLLRRYGTASNAINYFILHASSWVHEAMYEPSLEHIQAFFLLSVAQWGNGDRMQSSIHMGISVRMAGILRLHREETYDLPEYASAEEVVLSEMARRTFWVLETEDNLHSEHGSPVSFAPEDITALLPSDESDWAFGRVPAQRAALAGTGAAQIHPNLTNLPSRSLFATLLQAHSLWGKVARRACRTDLSDAKTPPWADNSDFLRTVQELDKWEADVPEQHRWSVWNMRGHSAESTQAAFMSIIMVCRLDNIVIRRVYMDDIVASLSGKRVDGSPPDFWRDVADALFSNVFTLHDSINTFISFRADNEGFSALLLFSLYVCGIISVQIIKNPQLWPDLVSRAEDVLSKSLEILADLEPTWPRATRWTAALNKSVISLHLKNDETVFGNTPLRTAKPSAGDEVSRPADGSGRQREGHSPNGTPRLDNNESVATVSNIEPLTLLSEKATSYDIPILPGLSSATPATNPDDSFEVELSQFLLGDAHYGMLSDWGAEQFAFDKL